MNITLETVGNLIALRQLILRELDGSETLLSVLLGQPQPPSDDLPWICPFQISGAGSEKVRYAAGADAFQSIELAMYIIGAHLESVINQSGGTITWLGQAGTGFPDSIPSRTSQPDSRK